MQAQKLSSYGSGTSATPLLGDTIGGSLARTVSRVPGTEAPVVVPSGRRWTNAELDADVTAPAVEMRADAAEILARAGLHS